MPEETKKLVTTTNKGLLLLAFIIEPVIILILFLSGFKKINPYLLLTALAVAVGFAYYFIRKPKELDLPQIVDKIKHDWYNKEKSFLNANGYQAVQIADVTLVYFPFEEKTFEFRNNKIIGVQTRHILNVVKEKEKSNLFKESIRYLGVESKIKQRAEELNIEPETLGL